MLLRLIRVVVPMMRSCWKTSSTPFVSAGMKFVAALVKTRERPSAAISGKKLCPFPGRPPQSTLARTVVTSFTVLIALGVLMAIGPQVIFGLSIAIFLGVVIGTYSSIYISSPVLVWLGVQPDSFLRADDKEDEQAFQPK